MTTTAVIRLRKRLKRDRRLRYIYFEGLAPCRGAARRLRGILS